MNPAELRAWRKARRWRQVDLGDRLGISSLTVWRYENGEQAVPVWLPLALRGIEAVDDGATLREIAARWGQL